MTKRKSPSTQKRDKLRIRKYNAAKMKALEMKILSLEKDLKKKTSTIFKLEVEKSDSKFKM